MKQALEALESTGLAWPQVKQSIAALCLAIEQAEKQEPVAWGVPNTRITESQPFMMLLHSTEGCQYPEMLVPLYTAPPQRQPLTEEEFDKIENRVYCRTREKGKPLGVYVRELCRAIERAHGITGENK